MSTDRWFKRLAMRGNFHPLPATCYYREAWGSTWTQVAGQLGPGSGKRSGAEHRRRRCRPNRPRLRRRRQPARRRHQKPWPRDPRAPDRARRRASDPEQISKASAPTSAIISPRVLSPSSAHREPRHTPAATAGAHGLAGPVEHAVQGLARHGRGRAWTVEGGEGYAELVRRSRWTFGAGAAADVQWSTSRHRRHRRAGAGHARRRSRGAVEQRTDRCCPTTSRRSETDAALGRAACPSSTRRRDALEVARLLPRPAHAAPLQQRREHQHHHGLVEQPHRRCSVPSSRRRPHRRAAVRRPCRSRPRRRLQVEARSR